jgi:hypothetical protein
MESELRKNRPYPGQGRPIRKPGEQDPDQRNNEPKKISPGRIDSDEPGHDEEDGLPEKGRCQRIELPNVPWLFPQG